MKQLLLLITFCIVFSACTTVDVDKRVRGTDRGKQEPAVWFAPIETPPEVVVIEQPVFVPDSPAQPPRSTGVPAVRDSNKEGIIAPSEYSHAMMIYDYHSDWVYEVYTKPLRVSDIYLEPGEQIGENPFISDSERWMLGAGVSYDSSGMAVQHIYVKPTLASLEASLIINTNRRVYHIILRSYKDVHMPMVRWRYPSTGMPNNYLRQPTEITGDVDLQAPSPIDPRFLSFNYRITYGWFRKPVWLPELAYDDGKKTYITFPPLVLQRELPAIFENRRDVVNYRVAGNLVIIDKLIEQITVKIERTEITITKKQR